MNHDCICSILSTDRLILNPTSLEDVDLLLKIDGQEEAQKFLGGIKDKSREERLLFLQKKLENPNSYSFTVSLKDGTKIGFVGFKLIDKTADISYLFDADYYNQGYCTEACRKMMDYALEHYLIEKFTANTVIDHKSSQRVLTKIGFVEEHRDSEFIYYNKKD